MKTELSKCYIANTNCIYIKQLYFHISKRKYKTIQLQKAFASRIPLHCLKDGPYPLRLEKRQNRGRRNTNYVCVLTLYLIRKRHKYNSARRFVAQICLTGVYAEEVDTQIGHIQHHTALVNRQFKTI